MKKLLLFICFCVSTTLFSQNIKYGQSVVDTLASSYFAGRGAVDDGELKAAKYIAKQYKLHGLKTFNNSYFQQFLSPINTIVGVLSVKLDKTILVAGQDYIVGASSGKVDGEFQLVRYDKENLPSKKELNSLVKKGFFKNKFIVLDKKSIEKENEVFGLLKENSVNASGLIFLEEKLTQHLSKTNKEYGILHILREQIGIENKVITVKINQELLENYHSQNVIGFVEGSEHPDSIVVLSAHYDHLGKMGTEVYFPGANDNASGVALLLNFAEHYSQKEQPKKTIVFIAFGAEETGLVGSEYFVQNPPFKLKHINFVFNMDLMGTGSKGATIVNGSIFKNHFNILVQINERNNYLPTIKKRGKAANSDHYWFSEKGIPSFFIYLMGGINAYHDIYDVSETLPLTKFEDSFRLIRDFVNEL